MKVLLLCYCTGRKYRKQWKTKRLFETQQILNTHETSEKDVRKPSFVAKPIQQSRSPYSTGLP